MARFFEITPEMFSAASGALSPTRRSKHSEKYWSDLTYDMKRLFDFLKDYRPPIPKFYGRASDIWQVQSWNGRAVRTLTAAELLVEDILNKGVDWGESSITVNGEDAPFLWPSLKTGESLSVPGDDIDSLIRAALFDGQPRRRPLVEQAAPVSATGRR